MIRFGAHRDDFEKDRRAASFATPDLPVPEVVEIGSMEDGYFAISTRAYGEPLECLSAPDWVATLPSLFGVLDALRNIDVSTTTGYGGWDASGRARVASWRDFLLSVEADTATAGRTDGGSA